MRHGFKVALIAVIVAASSAVMLPVRAAAQLAPPASIFSGGGTHLGAPGASIFSGFPCCRNGFGGFNGFGGGFGVKFGGGFGHNPRFQVGFGGRRFGGFGGRRFGGFGFGQTQVVPVFVPSYSMGYYPYYPMAVIPPGESVEGAGTFDRGASDDGYYSDSREVAREAAREAAREVVREEAQRAQAPEPSAPAEAAKDAGPQPVEEITPTVLVFRDGHESEVANYAIMGSTLFVLSGEHSKIPLSELDLVATREANELRGLSFHVPSAKSK
ncbi:MAG TPA: hypothetical protein VN622_11775 [Clostridia bacterium]|nr:hypothetical protein [Clostridia bacterium]